ncbi:MAG: metallophosphoesterase [Oscillospiraceae bacterium]|nr:metallophosphoesterase [Oscillospiraceae bacterium]
MMMEDSFFWFRKHTLALPGVKGEHLLMHISDTHISAIDEESTPEEKAECEKQEALWADFKEKFARGKLPFSQGNDEPYGEPQKISTVAAFEKQMALAEELKPEVLLLSGDNLDHMHPAGERYLRKKLAQYSGKYLCVPGNHEEASCEGVWEPGVRTLEMESYRIVAVDNSQKTVSTPDLEALKALCAQGKPIILLCHIPLSTAACREEMHRIMDYFYIDGETADENGREFVSLCEQSEAIRAVLCGHVHGYHEMEYAPGKLQVIGSQGMAGAVHLLTVTG